MRAMPCRSCESARGTRTCFPRPAIPSSLFRQLAVAFILLSSITTPIGCTGFMQTEHRAQFYLNDGYLCEAAAQFLADGLRDGGSIVLITSTPRRDSIASHLLTHGFDLTPLGNSGKATVCDAHQLREIAILQQRAQTLEAELEQRKALERALRQAIADRDASSRLKDEFLAVVSHELRTPLNAILGWTQIATGQETDASTIRRALGIIQRNATAQLHVVNDLLDVSRIVAGQMPMSADSIDLGETIAAAIETVKPAALAKNVQIDFTIEPDSRLVVGDPARLQQVFWKLFANAIKFTPPRGRVDVRLGRDGLYALITVTDTGEGIDAEFLPHLFERFRQADGGPTRKHGGLGLGLAVVRYLVEAHGGSVAAQSAGESRGATFTVRLPAA